MKSILGLMLIGSLVSAEPFKAMGVPQYGTARSVKVCATYPTLGMSCGTGLLLGRGDILTQNHIIGHISVQTIHISTNGIMLRQVEEDPQKILILRQDEQEFIPAILTHSDPQKDLAMLNIEDKVTPAIIFDDSFYRGQEVFAIGNPASEDFKAVKTKVVGVYLFQDRNLIMIESKKNEIRSGFSGGGIFNKGGGLIGVVEVCSEQEEVCAGISASFIKDWLKSLPQGDK